MHKHFKSNKNRRLNLIYRFYSCNTVWIDYLMYPLTISFRNKTRFSLQFERARRR